MPEFIPERKFVGEGNVNDVIDAGFSLGEIIRDLMVGNGGNDVMQSGAGDDFLLGNAGNDSLFGNRGNDILFGGDGTDALAGGIDSDTLNGDYGADTLTGDNANVRGFVDTFVFDFRTAGFANKKGALASDTITDFEAGIDVLDFTGFTNGVFSFVDTGNDVQVFYDNLGNAKPAYLLVTILNTDIASVQAASDDFGVLELV